MLDTHQIAVSAVPTRLDNNTVSHCYNGTARRRSVIRREVRASRAQDWMHPAGGKTGTHTRSEPQRRSEDRAFERDALLVVVRILKQESAIPAARVDELRRPNLSVLHEIPIVNCFINDQAN